MVIIRKAKLEDVEDLVSLENDLFNNQIEYIKKSNPDNLYNFKLKKDSNIFLKDFLKSTVHSKNALLLVADFENKIVGYLLIIIKKNIPIFKLEKLAEITDLYIKDEFRGRNISSKLIDEGFKWCKSKNISTIMLDALPNNDQAINVYKKWGFDEFLVEMRKKL